MTFKKIINSQYELVFQELAELEENKIYYKTHISTFLNQLQICYQIASNIYHNSIQLRLWLSMRCLRKIVDGGKK